MSRLSEGNVNPWKPAWQRTGLGSLPLADPVRAVDLVIDRFPRFPFWPQLSGRGRAEDIRVQYLAGLPMLELDGDGEVRVNSALDEAREMTAFYEAEMAGDLDRFGLTEETGPGFFELVRRVEAMAQPPKRLKGQVVGPLTFLQAAKDHQGRMVLHLPDLAQACARGLGLAGAWQALNLPSTGARPLIMIDDPGFYLVGSAFLGLTRAEAMDLLNQTAAPIRQAGALVGVHCCANTDWSMLLEAEVDVLSFDAHGYGESLILYARQAADFLERGGVLAWGVVPTTAFSPDITAEGLLARLGELKSGLIKGGADPVRVEEQALLTPACGLGALDRETAVAVIDLLDEVHGLIRGG